MWGLRSTLLVKPFDELSINASVYTQRQHFDGFQDITGGTDNPGNRLVQNFISDVQEPLQNNFTLFNVTVKYDQPSWNLTSSTGYYLTDNDIYEEGSSDAQVFLGAPAFANTLHDKNTLHNFTEEARVANTNSIYGFDGVFGVFFSKQDEFRTFSWAPSTYNAIAAPDGPTDPLYIAGNNIYGDDEEGSEKQTAVFGELTYHFTKSLAGIFGIRHYDITNTHADYLSGYFNDPAAPLVVQPVSYGTTSLGTVYKGNLSYNLTPAHLVYLQFSEGFRPGFDQVPPPSSCGVSADAANVKPDSIKNYEVGTKTTWLEGRLTANLAAYRINWRGIQQAEFLACGFNLVVMDVLRIDEKADEVYFSAVGRESGEDPYQTHLYRIHLDGSRLRALTPENADHEVHNPESAMLAALSAVPSDEFRESSLSPDGRFFIDTYSRPDQPPTTVVRKTNGEISMVLETADVSAWMRGGLVLPQPFNITSPDGLKLYGTMYRPSTFDPQRQYPVIDLVYPGPQIIVTPKTFRGALTSAGNDFFNAQALAEVGFIVFHFDGKGTPLRSKSFHDLAYGHWADGGDLAGHVDMIRQLADRYPQMDLQRVGITGHSGGGFAAARAMLAYPDFFKVAVASSGAHDLRPYLVLWGPTYQGPYSEAAYADSVNGHLAANLKGKLLLVHGDMDDNVHPAITMQLVDALIKANKDFDLLILPGQDHFYSNVQGYFQRKRWDYFVRNLLLLEPPVGYVVRD